MSYWLADGRVHTPEGCELNVVHHCNLSCRSCSHLSPVFRRTIVDPDRVHTEFSILAKYYRPRFIKLLGGEPLLHPGLPDVIDAIRSSGISDHILVCTNGLMLPRMSEAFWDRIDEVEISVYPTKALSEDQLAGVRAKAAEHGVRLRLLFYENFRLSYSEVGTADEALVNRIYATCKVAHVWRCHNVFDGHFFKCPQSIFIPLSRQEGSPYRDGLPIVDTDEFGRQLLSLLRSTAPLRACRNCLGSVGKLIPHEQADRRVWRLDQEHPSEDMVDWEFLTVLEADPGAHDSCARASTTWEPATSGGDPA